MPSTVAALLRQELPDSERPRTVTLKKRIVSASDYRFKILSQLNDGTPFYWYFRQQNGAVAGVGGPRCYGAYLDRDQVTDAATADFLAGGTMELAANVKPASGGAFAFTGTTHGHVGAVSGSVVFEVDGEVIDYAGAALNALWTGESIRITYTHTVNYGDDTGPWALVTRVVEVTRAGLSISQRRQLLADTYIGDSEYVGQFTVEAYGQGGTAAAYYDSVAVDDADDGAGVTGMGAGTTNYQHARCRGFAFYGRGYIAAAWMDAEVPATRLADGYAGYITDRADSQLKAYHLVTNGSSSGVLYETGDTVTTAAHWQVYAETATATAALAGLAAGTYENTPSITAKEIGDAMRIAVRALVPALRADLRFRPYPEDGGDFRDFAEHTPSSALRMFSVRDAGSGREPGAIDGRLELVERDWELVVAYPKQSTGEAGARAALSLEYMMESDARQLKATVGTAGFQTLGLTKACVINEAPRITALAACTYLVIPLRVTFWRQMT